MTTTAVTTGPRSTVHALNAAGTATLCGKPAATTTPTELDWTTTATTWARLNRPEWMHVCPRCN